MTRFRSEAALGALAHELVTAPGENECLEFKENNHSPQDIGEYVSALSNSAALHKKAYAYMVWGVEDESREIVGTNFSPTTAKKGNEPLKMWLLNGLDPKIDFTFYELKIQEKPVVLLVIECAYRHPVRFRGV